jgi:hypothetical protein
VRGLCVRTLSHTFVRATSLRRAWYRRAAIVADLKRTESTRPPGPTTAIGPDALHLVVAWACDQPELVGYSAPIQTTSLLGRGEQLPEDPAPRVAFSWYRPSGQNKGPALTGSRISCWQLWISPLPGGALAVKSLGRCPLLLNGELVQSCEARPGDTLLLQDSLLLLVVSRPVLWFTAWGAKEVPFQFGAPDPHGIIGESQAAWELRGAIGFAAQSSQHVLVHGPSGSGKELAARAIHRLSSRRQGPFIPRNAATIPEGLVDAELFGNVRNYPNPGTPERRGLIGEVHGGTLFLDEIGEMRHDLQAHLLRVLDRGGEYQRLGEAQTHHSDFRLVAATNRPIASLKHDLAARFTLRVPVPGLGERREDIPLLVRHLLASAAREHPGVDKRYFEKRGRRVESAALEPVLLDALMRHDYTHHTRELNQLLWVALTSASAATWS